MPSTAPGSGSLKLDPSIRTTTVLAVPVSSFPPSVPPPPADPMLRGPRLITIGGGRGGVGKSVLAANTAVYLAQLGRSVILADLDPAGSRLHSLFGLPPSAQRPASETGSKPVPIATPIPGLFLVPPPRDLALSLGGTGSYKISHFLELRELGADYVLLDVGVGARSIALDLFLAADVGVCVVSPEPPAIETTYGFLRALFLRRVRRILAKDKFKARILDRAVRELTPFPNPPQIIAALTHHDPAIAKYAVEELARLCPKLAVCQTRIRSDLELGLAMRSMAWRYLGIDLDYLGYVEQDDAVWLTVRRRRPLLVDNPTAKGARNMERIARRILALAMTRDSRATDPQPSGMSQSLSFYELLGVPRGASEEEVRRAYKRQRETYADGSLALTALLSADELAREQTRLEEAYDTLLDPNRRRAYDLMEFGEQETENQPSQRQRAQAEEHELLMLQSELAREIHAQTEFSGPLLRKVRESQGIEIAEIAGKTKISLAHLRAIEEDAFEELPALVYTRGFVQELAKFLRLDAAQVTRTYLKRMREVLSLSGRSVS